jgi:hypothetical protein
MPGISRSRAGHVVVAVLFCSLLVAACLTSFTASSSPSGSSVQNGASSPLVHAVHGLASHTRLAAPLPPSRSSAPAGLQFHARKQSPRATEGIATEGAEAVVQSHDAGQGGPGSGSRAFVGAVLSIGANAAPPNHVLSQSQFSAEVKKISVSRRAVAEGLSSAIKKMNKLKQEEHNLRNELEKELSKITSSKIVTSLRIGEPDGMGGEQMELIVTRPLGGKTSVEVINGAVTAPKNAASDHEEKYLHTVSSPFPSHEKDTGSDGLGGFAAPLAPKAAMLPPAAASVNKGLAINVGGDDGLGGRTRRASVAFSNAGRNEAPFRVTDKRSDGVGGSGKKLFRRRSNEHTAKAGGMKKVRGNDGVGGDVRYREARQLRKVPRNRIRKWARDCGDGLGGTAVWCSRLSAGAAKAKSSSSAMAAIKAAVIAHDTAAKQRAGLAPHHHGLAAAGVGKASSSSSATGDRNDRDDDQDGGDGGDFGSFGGMNFGNGNAGFDNGGFSDGRFADNGEGGDQDESQIESSSGDHDGDSEAAGGGSAVSVESKVVSKLHAVQHESRSAGRSQRASANDAAQNGQGDSDSSSSVGDFQDQDFKPDDDSSSAGQDSQRGDAASGSGQDESSASI